MSGAGAVDGALLPGVIRSARGLVINQVGIAKHQRGFEENFPEASMSHWATTRRTQCAIVSLLFLT